MADGDRPALDGQVQAAAEEAVRDLITFTGDDPDREGLRDTPRRVTKAYREFFAGYDEDPASLLERTFSETAQYDEIVLLRDIEFVSFCEHHMLPVIGKAHVAYLPGKRVVGISKLARLVDVFARRLQIQERMTAEIARTLNDVLQPQGVAVIIEAEHSCMRLRGVKKQGASMTTSHMLGVFRENATSRAELLTLLGHQR
jgi:GTP cyclohydrolase I